MAWLACRCHSRRADDTSVRRFQLASHFGNDLMVKILVPTDFSRCSLAALKHASTLIRATGGSLLILHVTEVGPQSLIGDLNANPDPLRQDIALLLQSFSQLTPPIHFEERRVEGVPVTAILSAAEADKVDMIVMGTNGRSGLKRLLLGSVAEEVTRRARCPVLVFKSQDDEEEGESAASIWEHWTALDQPPKEPRQSDLLQSVEVNDNPTLALITRAISARATDIHIDPSGQEFTVRFRIDGRISPYCRLSKEVGRALITQLKVTANLDIADPFHAKEGRLRLPESLYEFEVRITVVPVIDGEAVSLRILSRNRLMRPMEQLGLSSQSHDRIGQILQHGEGIVLVTGPTGSGKTTTLYSMLRLLDDGTRNIVTIEDPVEYNIPSFRQLSVYPKHGITMTSGLKALLRLDPDIVLIGEIRDGEAGETSMRAASSGKYVFSSLHTRDVASTVTALRDLHLDNRSLAANIAGIISQRLVRRLCSECRQGTQPTDLQSALFRKYTLTVPDQIYRPVGCPRCRGTGYFDRIGLYELVTSNDDIMRGIEEGRTEDELRELMHENGVGTMVKDALQKVAQGIVSIDEAAMLTTLQIPSDG